MDRPDVIVFSRTLDYRHESIPAAAQALRGLAAAEGLRVVATEDPAAIAPDALARAAGSCP